jgi:hypothetical protein
VPSEKEANAARRQHGSALMKSGVHAIGVEERKGRKDWVVVAHVAPGETVQLPESVSASTDKGTIQVPLVVRRSKPFAPE